ncbi:MAG: RagB/SusD family nutrient uptake outer membrane protein [Sphingobacteriaceae bacterium]|nr:MAG: RagB/SusD family nutrient uptake outer membrane protein [Sphingobacteriaceae bacterium]
MNKIYKNIGLGLLFLSSINLVSCKKDFLDTAPLTDISDATAFQTPDRILNQVNGLYTTIKAGQFYGGRYLIYNDIRAEEFIVNRPNGVTGLDTWRHNLNSNTDEVRNLWAAGYAAINAVNVFLDGIDKNPGVVTATVAEQYKGEAKYVRALTYYALLQLYAKPYTLDAGASPGLPLRLLAEKTTANNDLARSTVAQVYTQILADLNAAEATLPATYATAALNTSRASKNTAIALKTRIYLAMSNLPKVVEEANKIVSAAAPYQAATGVNLKLEASIATVFGGSYTGSEAVLFLPVTDLNAPGTQNQLAYYYNIASGGGNEEYYLNPAGILANPALAAGSVDGRRGLIAISGGKSFITKYKKPSPYSDYIPVMRYSEVLLNLAEATVVSDPARSIALLTAVRQRSNPAAYT